MTRSAANDPQRGESDVEPLGDLEAHHVAIEALAGRQVAAVQHRVAEAVLGLEAARHHAGGEGLRRRLQAQHQLEAQAGRIGEPHQALDTARLAKGRIAFAHFDAGCLRAPRQRVQRRGISHLQAEREGVVGGTWRHDQAMRAVIELQAEAAIAVAGGGAQAQRAGGEGLPLAEVAGLDRQVAELHAPDHLNLPIVRGDFCRRRAAVNPPGRVCGTADRRCPAAAG